MNAVVYSAAALTLTSMLILIAKLGGLSLQLDYLTKEVLVTAIAFLTTGIVSYFSIQVVRNGGLRRD